MKLEELQDRTVYLGLCRNWDPTPTQDWGPHFSSGTPQEIFELCWLLLQQLIRPCSKYFPRHGVRNTDSTFQFCSHQLVHIILTWYTRAGRLIWWAASCSLLQDLSGHDTDLESCAPCSSFMVCTGCCQEIQPNQLLYLSRKLLLTLLLFISKCWQPSWDKYQESLSQGAYRPKKINAPWGHCVRKTHMISKKINSSTTGRQEKGGFINECLASLKSKTRVSL